MRIGLNAWFWHQPTTGSGQYTRRLVEHLIALDPGLEILLVAPTEEGPFSSSVVTPANLQSDELVPPPRPNNLRKLWFEQVTFPHACRQLDADVAHVPYWAPPLRPSIPTVVTVHDLIHLLLREYRGGPLVRAYTGLVAASAPSADLILTDSEAAREDILAHLDVSAQQVRTVYLAAEDRYRPDPAPDDEEIRARYNLPSRYTLYLGGFDKRKNLLTLLRAYTWVGPVIGTECPFVVAGRLPQRDTPLIPDPRRQAEGLELDPDWLHFTGWVAEEDKPALYRGAEAFLFPSQYEGFGLPPLEAMACGTPVVGSDAASLPEVVGAGGVLLAPDDARGIAGAIIQLAQDSAYRARMARKALDQAARFSWERTARETLTAYREALRNG